MKPQLLATNNSFLLRGNWTWINILSLSVLAVIWLGSLGWRHLIPTDEGRYAEIAREMLVTGDFLVPRYNGYLYFEKPPLHLWATALTFDIFGLGEWQARLWSGLTSFGTILLVGYTCLRLWNVQVGTIATLVLAATPLWFIGGHFNSLDMALAFFLSGALCTLMLALHAPKQSWAECRWMLLCWVMMACAVLQKGLIGIVLPGMVLLVYSFTGRDWHSWSRTHWIKGLCLFFLITTPWFFLIAQKHSSFMEFFFIHEHFQRFTSDEHRRSAPWFFFLSLLFVGFMPWLGHLPSAFLQAFQEHKKGVNTFKPLWLCSVWVIVITLFFSLSQSKLPGYIFPVIPALAMVTACSIWSLFEKNTLSESFHSSLWKLQLMGFIVIFITGFFFLSKIAQSGQAHEVLAYAQFTQVVTYALSVGLLGCGAAWLFRKNAFKSLFIFASTMMMVSLLAGNGHEYLGRKTSGYDLAMTAKPFIQANDPLYGVKILDHTVPFYLEHSLIMVEFQDELAFGISQEPHKWLPTVELWVQEWQAFPQKKAFALMRHQTFDELKQQGIPMEMIAQDATRIIVGKPITP